MSKPTLADVQNQCVPLGPKLRGTLIIGGRTIVIETSRGYVAFEWHSYCGPLPVNRKTGDGRYLDARHPFWSAIGRWLESGAEMTEGQKGVLYATIPPRDGRVLARRGSK